MKGRRIVKRMMLTLLCLIGFLQSVSQAFDLKNSLKWPPGTTGALGNKEGFNTTTNSSMVPASSGLNATAQWNGTTQAIQNNFGFPKAPVDGQKEKEPEVKTVTPKPKPRIIWHPFNNTDNDAPESSEGEAKMKEEITKDSERNT